MRTKFDIGDKVFFVDTDLLAPMAVRGEILRIVQSKDKVSYDIDVQHYISRDIPSNLIFRSKKKVLECCVELYLETLKEDL